MKKLFALLLTGWVMLAPLAHSEGIFDSKKFSFLNEEPELMPVDKAFAFDFQQQGNQLKVNFVIADGYYMYRDKLKIRADGATLAEFTLPKGKLHHDDYFGDQEVYYSYVDIPLAVKQAGDHAKLSVTFMGCAEGKLCFPPTTRTADIQPVAANDGTVTTTKPANTEHTSLFETAAQQSNTGAKAPAVVSEQDSLSSMLNQDNLALTLLIFFGLGIGLALTPCVFPMYPILSGIIVGQKQKLSTAKAFTLSMAYVQGMAITYSVLGLIVASAGMKYQAALQHPAVLIGLAILFVLLSMSMFGLYELRLPSRWQEKMNNVSNNQRGGSLTGVFVMGVISGLVASPCTTAPLSGVLIYVAQSGNLLLGFLTLYVLAMGMGLPLLLLGTSGGKLLPRAGRWMEVIKTIFGFLLLAVSVIMIGRIWPGIVSDLLWSVWGIAFTGYLMHQNKLTEFTWKQTVRSVLLTLTLLASFSYGFQSVMHKLGFNQNTAVSQDVATGHHFIKVKSLADLNAELAKAKAQGKPVLLDLYADWCVACKEFEKITFKDAEVKQRFAKMVLLKADVTKNDATDVALLEHFHVLGLPTLLMFDANGQQQKQLTVTGFMGPKDFAAHLDNLLQH
ncbi:thiol:disulfide interchange protein DsbD [Shewanella sp. NFH-SH190041]|uniref:protein-disulfide reductase DsbD n=1 Tax=Shewanella sp. NFH-SH190041 TaxID=2950245 RepID=UPI0021C4BCC3|nr:protein-disulfide reductase DsbD [Shewanella sp. NFH-SH190041]BDM63222.1 thiol:disulfide interchange protein DsbD [Shewanella sp. NFH-SH190041]